MDAHPSRYCASVRIQKHRQEYIDDLATMVKDLLIEFYKATTFKPHRIIVFRWAQNFPWFLSYNGFSDGVSEGQFQTVLSHELRAIRKACVDLESAYQPGISFIVVQKRHHTRYTFISLILSKYKI